MRKGWFVYVTKKSVDEPWPVVQILTDLASTGPGQRWQTLYVLTMIENSALILKTKKDAEKAKRRVQKHRVLTPDWCRFEVVSIEEFDRYRIGRELSG